MMTHIPGRQRGRYLCVSVAMVGLGGLQQSVLLDSLAHLQVCAHVDGRPRRPDKFSPACKRTDASALTWIDFMDFMRRGQYVSAPGTEPKRPHRKREFALAYGKLHTDKIHTNDHFTATHAERQHTHTRTRIERPIVRPTYGKVMDMKQSRSACAQFGLLFMAVIWWPIVSANPHERMHTG